MFCFCNNFDWNVFLTSTNALYRNVFSGGSPDFVCYEDLSNTACYSCFGNVNLFSLYEYTNGCYLYNCIQL